MDLEFENVVLAAAVRPDVRVAVQNLYHRLAQEIRQRRPLCTTSGRCCRFEEYGHRLFATTMELATFFFEYQMASHAPALTAAVNQWDGLGCPSQVDKLCGVHPYRPFGCRIYFCDATATTWQHEQYASFHAELKRLHDSMEVPYFYVEWRHALEILHIAG